MDNENFTEECRQFWIRAITASTSNNPPVSATWQDIDCIQTALQPFMARDRNHAHLPTGGGLDILSVDTSAEPGCLEFGIGPRHAHVVKPRSLILEYILESPIDSFLLLELAELQSSGIYEQRETKLEDLVELERGRYADLTVLDDGFSGYDEEGLEIPLPHEYRQVTRWLEGKFLIVSKRSFWNGTSGTYDGRHNAMNAIGIRRVITKALVGLKG